MPLKQRDMISMSDPKVAQIGHPAPPWMVNYADLMTEMVCFFIILYALSAALNKDVQKAKKEVEEMMKQVDVAGEVKMTKDGLQITLQEQGENVFFTSGSADLSGRMVEILSKISPSLRKLADDGHDIIVEGHTDKVPIHNAQFSSNWELSTARATNVVHHMILENGLPAKHMAAIGYGEFKPLVLNDTDEHRSMNRRVVFFVKNKASAYDKGIVTKVGKPPKPEVVPAEEAPTESAAAEAPPGEPAADSALPLPAEAPAEEAQP
jgi:chemotaxis protein MotB